MPLIALCRSSPRTLLAVTLLSLSLSLSVAACGGACPPLQRDDVFPLDLSADGGVIAGAAPDGGAPSTPYQANCGSLAEACTPGQPCPPACDCVLRRQRMGMNPMAVIDQCILVAGATPPSVEVRSHIQFMCE